MQIKTISYKRILSLGNYESKHLEMFVDIHEGDDVDAQTSYLMEKVERNIREEAHKAAEEEIKGLKRELRKLTEAVRMANSQRQEDVPDIDSIPFKSGDAAKDSGIPEGF